MRRLTVRLPDALHHRLRQQAEREGVSLDRYVVGVLRGAVATADLDEERAVFERLKGRYAEAEAEAALREVLAAREG